MKQERQKIDNCCLAMIDIDYFKKINDAFGHLAGDAVLKDLAKIFVRSLRRNDIVARIGGEEFVILLRDVTPDIAYETMERIRKVVEHYTFNYQSSHFKVTISIGLAEYSFRYENVDQWISIADEKLYEAKRLGRNKSVQ
ncbi:GGDEF domain-containing protein [Aeromonas veronii]